MGSGRAQKGDAERTRAVLTADVRQALSSYSCSRLEASERRICLALQGLGAPKTMFSSAYRWAASKCSRWGGLYQAQSPFYRALPTQEGICPTGALSAPPAHMERATLAHAHSR